MIKVSAQAQAVAAKFKELSSTSPQMLRALEAFARVLRTRVQLAFRQGKSPSGKAWPALKFRQGQPLRDTGRLYGSIVARRDGDGVVVGTNLKLPNNGNSLGAVHQFGMTIKPKTKPFLVFPVAGKKGFVFARQVTIPARPFMPLDSQGEVALPPAWEKAAVASMARALGVA